ncbi:MAG: hypothetical protein Q8O55_05485 [Dehalococcoidales bacterium]|nr:hypothetical protein [Dehalococcoidales bacterium]
MSKLAKGSLLVISIFLLAVIFTGCSSRLAPSGKEGVPSSGLSTRPTNGPVQTNSEGAVSIDVEWVTADDAVLVFNVAMNTHVVDLDSYDLGKLALLRDDAGNEYYPLSWDSAPGGHHREGRLTFPAPASLTQGGARYIEIMIRDVADIKERVLKWQL